MIEIGPNLKDLILTGISIIGFVWFMVTAIRSIT